MPRCIDVCVLKEWIENWLYKDRYYHNGRVGKTIPITELYDILEQLPTVDVPDRKVGEWIKNELNGAWHCSECGEDNYYAYCWSSEKGEYELQDRYCPSCGSRMRGEGDEPDRTQETLPD